MTDHQTPRYVARRSFGYGGQELARGQVFTLLDARNDTRLQEMRYMMPLELGAETFTCPECGAEILTAMVPPEGHSATHRLSAAPAAAQER